MRWGERRRIETRRPGLAHGAARGRDAAANEVLHDADKTARKKKDHDEREDGEEQLGVVRE